MKELSEMKWSEVKRKWNEMNKTNEMNEMKWTDMKMKLNEINETNEMNEVKAVNEASEYGWNR